MKKISIHDGLMFDESNDVIGCIAADKIAHANGFMYAERMVEEHSGKTLTLDDDLKIARDDLKSIEKTTRKLTVGNITKMLSRISLNTPVIINIAFSGDGRKKRNPWTDDLSLSYETQGSYANHVIMRVNVKSL